MFTGLMQNLMNHLLQRLSKKKLLNRNVTFNLTILNLSIKNLNYYWICFPYLEFQKNKSQEIKKKYHEIIIHRLFNHLPFFLSK